MIGQDAHTAQLQPLQEETAASEGFNRLPGVILLEVFTQLAYRKWLIAKVTGFAIFTGLVLCFVLPTRYTATTRILPPQQTQSEASLFLSQLANSSTGPLAALAGGGLGLKNPDDEYIGLLRSRPIADAIIQGFGLAKVYHSGDLTAARQKLTDNTEIVPEKSGLIAISVTDRDKKQAAAMANAYTDQLRHLTKNLAVTEASQRRLFYEEQLKQVKANLVAAEYAFQQVQQQKGLVQPDAQARALIGGVAALHAEIAAKQVELQSLRSYSTESNPSVQLAENQLSSLQEQVSGIEHRNHSSGLSDLGIEDVPAASLDYLRAEHEFQFQQTLSDLLLKQYEGARLDEAREGSIIQVVEPAIPPDRRSSPRRGMILALFAISGFLVGCMVVLVLRSREIVQSDPAMLDQVKAFRFALTGRRATGS